MNTFATSTSRELTFGTDDHVLTGTTQGCVSSVKFTPQGCPMQLVGVAGWDTSCSVWEVGVNGKQVISRPAWTTSHDAPILDMSFSSDGRAFFGGCSKTAIMWDLRTNQKTTVGSHDLPVSCLDYVSIPQVMNDLLITGSWDGKLRWWDLRQPNFIKELSLGEPIFDLDAQKTQKMMSVTTGRSVHVFSLDTMEKVQELKPPSVVLFNLRCVASSPLFDGVCVGTAESRVSFIPLTNVPGATFKAHNVKLSQCTELHQVNFCAVHPTLPLTLSGGGDGRLVIIDREKKKLSNSLPCKCVHDGQPIPISAGDVTGDFSLVAYAHSYDWAMGKGGYNGQPTSVHIRTLQ